MLAIGLMSGTSLDGVDAAMVLTDGERVEAFGDAVLAGRPFPYPSERDLRLFTLMERSCR